MPSASSDTRFSARTETHFPPRVAVAAALLQHLEPEQLAAFGAHEAAAITELGRYALDAAAAQTSTGDPVAGTPPDPSIEGAQEAPVPANHSEHADDAAALADSYLRATIGYARYNQLSILAATRAYEASRSALGSSE